MNSPTNLLSFKVGFSHTAELVFVPCALSLGSHPLHAVQPFLKKIRGPRLEVALLPKPQAIPHGSVWPLEVTPSEWKAAS